MYGTITDDSILVTEDIQGYLEPMAVRSSYPMAKELRKIFAVCMLRNMA